MSSKPYLIATRNPGKLRELRELFHKYHIAITDLVEAGVPEADDEEAIESWDTLEENALAKAQYFHRRTGMPTFADDSGLEVALLDGAPGVRSRRFSGRSDLTGKSLDAANNASLLAAIRRAGTLPTAATFACAAAYADSEHAVVRVGRTPGTVVQQPRGAGGFGYDSHFMSQDLGETFGEASEEAKLRVGHRGRAFRELLLALRLRTE